MPRNGTTGVMTLVYDWEDDDANDIPIRSDRMQEQDEDIATALTNSIAKDGQTTPTANLPMGSFKLTGLGAGTVATDAAQLGQVQSGIVSYATATGTDTYALTLSPAITAYAAGQRFTVIFTNANTGAATINVSALGAKDITKNGTTALVAGDIPAGSMMILLYDGTRFQISKATYLGLALQADKTEAFTAAAGSFYTCNFSAAGTITLPASATRGDVIGFALGGGFVYTFNPNSLKINGSTSNLSSDATRQTVLLTYTGTTDGWV